MTDPIVQSGSAVLRQVAKPVSPKEFGSRRLLALIKSMSAILTKEDYGVAIAAPQVGVSERLFVVAGHAFIADEKNKSELPVPPDRVFINPEIIRLSRKKKEMSEGCLSVRGKYGSVIRYERASLKAQDEQGHTFTYHGTGLIAHIFQHECDHLDGILYTDKAEHLRNDTPKEKSSTVKKTESKPV